MMDAATQALVQDLIRQEGRSMLQYVVESFPWTTRDNEPLLLDLRQMADEERRAAEGLAKLLLRHHARPPFLGAYPMSFTTINFVALDHLLPRLIRFQKDRVADLEASEKRILQEDARMEVRSVLDLARRQLTRLERLAAGETGHADETHAPAGPALAHAPAH
ncbi:MAG: hypothetical protein U0793_28460 [Gemmataceae bacterium]